MIVALMRSVRGKAIIMLIGYSLLLIYWMLFGFGRVSHSTYMYNLKPFSTIGLYLRSYEFMSGIWLVNLIGNIGVFVPFGILLPLVFRGNQRRSWAVFIIGVFVLESLQLLLKRGSFDVDDFILNTLGFGLGLGVYKICEWMMSRGHKDRSKQRP
ncbi:VanZ family protein [Paenibacillus macerans]|uniref:VanZ like family protein n=2 Tax=Paenibacillus macerans TaxID=44252 RepID=A0A090YUK1_PAEMA|nr:vanZ like family protein [Paenibacillus macerans]SUA83944.1 VanZ family protein [Paenibacillus macerans]